MTDRANVVYSAEATTLAAFAGVEEALGEVFATWACLNPISQETASATGIQGVSAKK